MKNLVKGLILSGNIPYIKGFPGMAKSATMKSIADLNKWLYIDLRLSQKDETDISGLPTKATSKLGVPMTIYTLPPWFVEAKESADQGTPVLIHFEELNRTTKAVRDSCLEILNERTINGVKLPSTVYMVASGNLGSEDGCDIDDLDAAMTTRLVPLEWKMSLATWIKDYAEMNVDNTIVNFLKENPAEYHRPASKSTSGASEGVYPNPRTWTNLSKYIKYLKDTDISYDDLINNILKIGASFIGTANIKFVKYLKSLKELTLDEVLNDFKKVENKIDENRRTVYSPVLSILVNYNSNDFSKLTNKQVDNLIAFSNKISKEDKGQLMVAICSKASLTDMKNPSSVVSRFYLENEDMAELLTSIIK